MFLKEYNWDTQLEEKVEYPNELIEPFIDFLRCTKQWPERLEIMYNRFQIFNRTLTDHRNEVATKAAEEQALMARSVKAGFVTVLDKSDLAMEDEAALAAEIDELEPVPAEESKLGQSLGRLAETVQRLGVTASLSDGEAKNAGLIVKELRVTPDSPLG